MNKILAILSILGALSFQSCADSKQNIETSQNLNGNWELNFIYDSSGTNIKEGYPQKLPSLSFETNNQRVSGNDGCNQLFGSFSTKQNSITFSQLGVTNMYCEGVKDFVYRQTLEEVKKFQIKDNQLNFYNDKGELVLRYSHTTNP